VPGQLPIFTVSRDTFTIITSKQPKDHRGLNSKNEEGNGKVKETGITR